MGIDVWFPVNKYRMLALFINDSEPASLWFLYAYEDYDLDRNLTSV